MPKIYLPKLEVFLKYWPKENIVKPIFPSVGIKFMSSIKFELGSYAFEGMFGTVISYNVGYDVATKETEYSIYLPRGGFTWTFSDYLLDFCKKHGKKEIL